VWWQIVLKRPQHAEYPVYEKRVRACGGIYVGMVCVYRKIIFGQIREYRSTQVLAVESGLQISLANRCYGCDEYARAMQCKVVWSNQ
jgi:hypothetical protein